MATESSKVTGSLTALNGIVTLGVDGYGGAGIALTGTFTGTVTFQGSVDGVTFATLTVSTFAGATATTATAAGQWGTNCASLKAVQVKMTSYTSGTCDVTLVAHGAAAAGGGAGGGGGAVTQGTSPWIVAGEGTAGTAATGVVTVQGIASMTPFLVTPAANSAVNVAQLAGTTPVTAGLAGTLAVGGSVATNVAITSNPMNTGGQAVSAENTAVTATRMVQFVADLVGKQIVLPYANPENFVSFPMTAAMTGTTSTITLAAPAAGLRNYITSITVSNGSSTIPTDILIQDGNGGTTLYVVPAPIGAGTGTGTSGGHYSFPVAIRQPTTATAIYVANVTTGSSTKVSLLGYKGV